MNIPFIHKETAAILQRVTFESIELEKRVNEVAYKVISLINITHTQRETYEYSNWRIMLFQISRF